MLGLRKFFHIKVRKKINKSYKVQKFFKNGNKKVRHFLFNIRLIILIYIIQQKIVSFFS